MWIDQRLPRLRRRRAFGAAVSVVLVATAIALRAVLPQLPPFLTFFPAVLLSAFLGGRLAGLFALVVTGLAGPFFLPEFALPNSVWGWALIAMYLFSGGLIIFIVDLLDNAIRRLRAERERLNLALRAANAGTWEWIGQEIRWHPTFYEVTGLDPKRHPPSLDTYLAHIHPDDLPRMTRLKSYIAGEAEPAPVDEFRFIRPDGKTVWLQTYRAVVDREERRVTGVTQDITARKEAEMRNRLLLREVTHRAKNQYSVISAVIRETARKAGAASLAEELEARLRGMGRSQDLLMHSKWEGAAIDAVVRSQLEPFGIAERCKLEGEAIMLSAPAVQYIGMALYELATNSIKYGALGAAAGKVSITWSLKPDASATAFQFEWREEGGPDAGTVSSKGFGRKVLEQIVPFAVQGTSRLVFHTAGVTWTLFAPVEAILPPETVGLPPKSERAAD